MKSLVLALPFLALAQVAFADETVLPVSLATDVPCVQEKSHLDSPQGQEEERMRLESETYPVMEYIYRYSELEAGVLYTDWASRLKLDAHVGGYIRWGVAIHPNVNVNIAFRGFEYDNSELTKTENEHVLERGLLVGVGLRLPLTRDFSVTGNAAAGFMRFDSRATNVGSDTGPALSFEGAVTAKIWEALRLKAGVGYDFVRTDFHQTSAHWTANLTYLVGFEIGM